jgi:asparagine synthase (glutamine-hydrolysing)
VPRCERGAPGLKAMCGIAGLLRFDGLPADGTLLERMIEVAHHRGPDDTGRMLLGPVGLAHKRLAIIDLNPRGRQPMVYAGRYWIVYNGEVYNYVELRAELERLGHAFCTTSDTEVILAAYAEWGHRCLSRFNGMWAFAIYDERQGELFLARDRFGVKPLTLAWRPDMLCFGSEIKQLLPVLPQRKANARRVLDYLVTGYENHTNETFFEGIETLPAGSWMRIARDGRVLDRQSFYMLTEQPEYARMDFDQAAEAVSALLRDAIRLRLRSDVRVGTCLSGGLDSSAISAIASELYTRSGGEEFLGVHAKSIERSTDESEFARQVAERAGIRLVTVEPRSDDFAATIDEVVYTQEEPFGSPSMFMGWHVFREAHRQGCRVMLNGQGCDEAFLGYERYYPLELDPTRPVDFIRRLRLQAGHSKLSALEALRYYLYFRHAFLRISRLKANRYVARPRMAQLAFDSVRESADSYARCFAMQKLEIESLQLPHLLRYEDRNSMRHSIETRLPFLDYRLMEAAVSIPLEHKLHAGWTKYVVRKVAEPHLPAEVTWRKVKLGFEAPTGVWFRERMEQMRREIESSPLLGEFADMANVSRDFYRLGERHRWVLFNLAAWARVYGVTA